MRQRAVFLDLNGTLVMPIKPHSLSELALIENAGQAIARISQSGFLCPVVTVQSRINKGVFSLEEFQLWFSNLASALGGCGASIQEPYVCPHRFSEPCECKSPQLSFINRLLPTLELIFNDPS
jgi:histidinol phosphatase-like enzyme